MNEITCFAPLAGDDAKVLILGSIPGVESLNQHQYYAHPRNSFWYIIANLFNFNLSAGYDSRCQALVKNKIALWDVLNRCIRKGSLDTAIENESIIRNDFMTFLSQHPKIQYVFFNGQKAQKEYTKYVLPELGNAFSSIQYQTLPSTSPAMASLNKDQKLEIWKQVKKSLLENKT